MISVGTEVFKKEGIRGLYRGGLPLFVGGTLFRSAQFGVNDVALKLIRARPGRSVDASQALPKEERILFNTFDYEIILGGFCGGIARGIIEAPFEFVKVRRQVEQKWNFLDAYKGGSVTIFRNSFLFMFFVVYIDIGNQLIPGGMTPFLKGVSFSYFIISSK